MVAFDENLLLYAGAALDQLADELHQTGAEAGVLLARVGCSAVSVCCRAILMVSTIRNVNDLPPAMG